MIKVLIVEDGEIKPLLIQRYLSELLSVPQRDLNVTQVRSSHEFSLLEDPFGFDIAFLDQHILYEGDASEFASVFGVELRHPGDKGKFYKGGWIANLMITNNPNMRDFLFSISAESVPNIPFDQTLGASPTYEAFKRKVGPKLEALIERSEGREISFH